MKINVFAFSLVGLEQIVEGVFDCIDLLRQEQIGGEGEYAKHEQHDRVEYVAFETVENVQCGHVAVLHV